MVGEKQRRQNNARLQPFASDNVSRLLVARLQSFLYIEACAVEVWILFHPSFGCFDWFSKNCHYTSCVPWKSCLCCLKALGFRASGKLALCHLAALKRERLWAGLGRACLWSLLISGTRHHEYWTKQTSLPLTLLRIGSSLTACWISRQAPAARWKLSSVK